MLDFHNEDCTCDFLSRVKSATIVEEPWRHLLVDDIFCQSCFDKIVDSIDQKNDTALYHDGTRGSADGDAYEGEFITKFRSDKLIQQWLDCAEYVYGLYPNARRYDSVY